MPRRPSLPALLVAGAGLLLAACLPGVARAQVVFSASGATATLDCRLGAARVQGSGNRLSIGGGCRGLSVAGSDNVVAVDLAAGGTVRVSGNDNRVLYHFAALPPQVQSSGADNQVLPDSRPVGTAAMLEPTVLVADAGSAYDLQCGGRDVVVRGDGLRFVLRGGCRSLTVLGSSDSLTAELLPGAAVSVGGAGVILNYVLVAPGPAPVVRVTASGLKATQIQHYGDSQLSLPTGH